LTKLVPMPNDLQTAWVHTVDAPTRATQHKQMVASALPRIATEKRDRNRINLRQGEREERREQGVVALVVALVGTGGWRQARMPCTW
jgi:hypothetical protein